MHRFHSPVRVCSIRLGVSLLVALPACGGEEASGGASSSSSSGTGGVVEPGGCSPGELPLEDGRCLAAGTQENGCPAGEVGLENGGCRSPGIPPDECGDGFSPDESGGCTAILPAEPCGAGAMALPGETSCREIAPCGTLAWGDIPIEADTEHVDGTYSGTDSDGSAAKPWTTIQAGVDAAAPGAIVAIAAGIYGEDVLVQGKPVRLWGRCPADVDIVSTGDELGAVFVREGADGTEIRDLGVSGSAIGLVVSGAEDVVMDRLWVHDTQARALDIEDTLGPTRIAMTGSLIEGAREAGMLVIGAEATVEATVVRDTRPSAIGQLYGRGVDAEDNPKTGRRANLSLRSMIVERNRSAGVYVHGADATIENILVRDTEPQASDDTNGRGINVQSHIETGERASVVLRTSVVESSHEVGVIVLGSDATIEATVVRDTQAQASDLRDGRGINISDDPDTGLLASATIRSSLVDNNGDAGIFISGATAIVEGTIVRGTQSQAVDGAHGRGISVQGDADTRRANVTLRGCLVDRNRETGVLVVGSDASIEGTLVRDTQGRSSDEGFGRGITMQDEPATGERSSMVLRTSAVRGSADVGVFVGGSDLQLEATLVSDTRPDQNDDSGGHGVHVQLNPSNGTRATAAIRGALVEESHAFGIVFIGADGTVDASSILATHADLSDGAFGDGVAVTTEAGAPASVAVTGTWIEESARAGISSFGASVSLTATTLECNAIDLDGEAGPDGPASLEDRGDNQCGCEGAAEPCRVLSSSIAPPEPIPSLGD